MEEYEIITDPNYRDVAAQSAYERVERVRTAEKLAYAAQREEKWLNEPFMIEKIIKQYQACLAKIKQYVRQRQH